MLQAILLKYRHHHLYVTDFDVACWRNCNYTAYGDKGSTYTMVRAHWTQSFSRHDSNRSCKFCLLQLELDSKQDVNLGTYSLSFAMQPNGDGIRQARNATRWVACWVFWLITWHSACVSHALPFPPKQSKSEVTVTPSNEAPSSYNSILEIKPIYINVSSSNLTLSNLFSVNKIGEAFVTKDISVSYTHLTLPTKRIV